MWIGGDPIDEVGASQLRALVENKVAESRRLEFKLELPGGKDLEKKEFLADVSALANTEGGVLLYGIATGRDAKNRDNGIADEVKGVALENVDGEVRRLTDIIRGGLNPPLTNFRVCPIPLEGDLHVVAIGVSRSLLLPHAVWFGKSGKFYKRSDAAKYQVDVSELRRLFNLANEWADQAKRIRSARLQQIQERISTFEDSGALVLHLMPLGRTEEVHDLSAHGRHLNQIVLPLRGIDLRVRFNLDGYLLESTRSDRLQSVQWFRFGGIELVSTISVGWEPDAGRFAVDAGVFQLYARSELPKALKFLSQELDVSGPFSVSVSLLGHDSAFIGKIPRSWDDSPYYENRFSGPWPLLVPAEVIQQGRDEDIEAGLKGLFDIFWQAFGFSESPNLREW